jgi:Ca-activated chloride channel family protein
VLVVLLLGTIFVWRPWKGDAEQFHSAFQPCTGPAQATVRIASSQDKDVLLGNAARDYGQRLVNGQCMNVEVRTVNSGTAMAQLGQNWPGDDRPDVWSPASSLWLPLAKARGTKLLPDAPTGQFIASPLVVAMPQPMAEALGWPDSKEIGWKRLAELARNPRGWADLRHPEWGRFWLGKTNPNLSSSGFNATIATFFAIKGKTTDLTGADILDPAAQGFVRDIEKSVAHYGETTLDFLKNLRRADDQDRDGTGRCTNSHAHALTYISAVTVEESSMLAYNDGWATGTAPAQVPAEKPSKPCTKLVAVYPSEGTLYSDHPYIELISMDPAKKPLSKDFLNYLRSGAAQARFHDYGFRGSDAKPSRLVTKENGALADRGIVTLGLPDGSTLNTILSEWSKNLRKQADILLLIDTSGSMRKPAPGGSRLGLVQSNVPQFLNELAGTDRVGLWEFNDAYHSLVPLGPLSEPASGATRRQALSEQIARLTPNGGTALYDTVAAAVEQFAPDPNAINAIILLTDGKNEHDGGLALGDERGGLLGKLRPTSDRLPVRVFTIAYGTEADEQGDNGKPGTVLEQISAATAATRYAATDPETIHNVLAAVFSNF